MWGALTILKSLCQINLRGRPGRKILGRPSDLSRCRACLLGDHCLQDTVGPLGGAAA
jgi:hypothetical protein